MTSYIIAYDTETGDPLSDEDIDERYRNMLHELYGMISIGDASWDAADVLKEMDPIAYRVGCSDYLAAELEEGNLTEDAPEEWDDDDDDNGED